MATNQAVDRLYFQSQQGFYNTTPKSAPKTSYLDELDTHGEVLHSYSGTIDNTLPPDPH